jgi:DNA-directed RNA polymerase subunit L
VAGDIEVFKLKGSEEPERLPSKEFFHPHPVTGKTALLAVLKAKVGTQPPEEIQCEMRAQLGTGKKNARYIPTSQCSYMYTLDTDEERLKEVFTTWLQSHKKINPSELDSDPTRKADLEREFNTMERQRCFLQQDDEPYSFDFTLETVGVLPTGYIVGRALEALKDRCIKYASIQAGELPPGLKVVQTEKSMRGYTFTFEGEDHTLGNLFDTWIEQNLMDTGDVSFVGYKPTHPLEDQIVIDIGIEDERKQLVDAKMAIARAAKGCADMFAAWRAAWEPFAQA